MEKSSALLYPALVVSGVSVTAFSLLGIATMTGWIPYANSQERSPFMQSMVAAVTPLTLTVADEKSAQIKVPCHACGLVESIRMSEMAANTSSASATAGADAGKPRPLRYVVHVSMDEGGFRTFYLDHQPAYRVGERILLDHGNPIAVN